MKKIISLLVLTSLFIACSNNNEKADGKEKKGGYEIDETFPPSGETTATTTEAKLEILISESKKTMDSIDVAYTHIRHEGRTGNLSLNEREQVSEVLIELSDAKDLIVLEMQESVVTDLKQKTAALQTMMQDMNTKSEQMMKIANTLSRVSGIIQKTTLMLTNALSVGVIRPRIVPATTS